MYLRELQSLQLVRGEVCIVLLTNHVRYIGQESHLLVQRHTDIELNRISKLDFSLGKFKLKKMNEKFNKIPNVLFINFNHFSTSGLNQSAYIIIFVRSQNNTKIFENPL